MMARILPYLVAVAIVLGALYGAYHHGVTTTTAQYELKLSEQSAANAQALANAQADVRNKEQAAAQEQAAIVATYEDKQSNAKTNTDRIIADLRSGAIRLRSDLASAQCALASVSDIAAGTGKRDAACTAGLRPADAEFLIRFAARADAVARQLQAAQAIIIADRKTCRGDAP